MKHPKPISAARRTPGGRQDEHRISYCTVFAIQSHDDEDVAFASWAQDSGSFYPRPLGLQTAAPPQRPTYRAAI